ncbi:MAG: UDP-N-acetylmuramate dehydrogenase [Cytophagales bacterium]|nr:UDP-N-acetylmuramate dehydrogenase [Cytophagales bacterium]
MKIERDFPLKKLNSFGLNVKAKCFVELTSIEEAQTFIKSGKTEDRSLVLGGGSNLLFTRDFNGLIIKVNIGGIYVVKEDADYYWVKSGAGVVWHELVESCIKANFGGLENLSLIPGTVGAAPIQNIGAYGVEIKDSFEALEALNLETGEKKYFNNRDCCFGYRDSIFKNELRDKYLITNVLFKLTKNPIIKTHYGRISEMLEKAEIAEPTIRDVSEAIIKIRRSKLPDPDKFGNAGSFFKNPVVPIEQFNFIQKSFSDVPSFPQPEDRVKIPAAWLIEKCNLKGKIHKGAAVHTKQPLVLINHKNAKGTDILDLSKKIQQNVKNKFGIALESEVRII